ncbi:hypothetical protein QWY16_10460 [Planococcus shenhongbingii]|uniref:Uncharacterized protein n=1 Tax=Planococcus shenhongbingii TaxID=3058398 RepID=A0ABT8NGL0_9BACL|nr:MULTISPECIES: hypothetical protein [unclassified Planococcus (in: firmicutes)]MDN7247036.1 hypothetical protein [Planococcus sp. N017]WKA56939.1 hypothetical protein QWY16_10460 [Planococcus sp. N016]
MKNEEYLSKLTTEKFYSHSHWDNARASLPETRSTDLPFRSEVAESRSEKAWYESLVNIEKYLRDKK